MKGLAGDLGTMPLKDLVVYLWNRQASGTLTLEQDQVKRVVVLDKGTVVNASSNLPREYLGQFLINLGHLSEEQFNRAYATQQETRVFIGRILVMIGLITEQVLHSVLSMKFRETLLEAFNWTDGNFTYDASAKPKQPEGLEVKVPLIEIHKEADFRVQAWEQFRLAFPRGDCTLVLDRANLIEPPRPGSVDEKLFNFIEAGMTIDEMGLRLHATEFFIYNRLYAYHRLGAIQVKQPAEPAGFDIIEVDLGLGDSPSAEQILENARTFLAQGNYRDAYSLAKRSNQITATLDAALLIRQVEVAWQPQLKAELLTSRVPTLTANADTIAKLSLSAPERYLISRIDGRRDVESIVRVAPLKEFDALAFFDRFVTQGWVTLR